MMRVMDRNRWLALWAGLLLLGMAWPAAAHNGAMAIAVPVEGIKVDGDLSDWPEGMRRYPIALPEYLDRPKDAEDFQGTFRIGYTAQENALYVAVEVEDESTVIDTIGTAWGQYTQDSCDIYVEVVHGETSPVGQYVVVGNERIVFADGALADVEVEMHRGKRIRQYEWRIDVSRIRRGQGYLHSGMVFGFDVAVGDMDQDGSYSWMAWGKGIDKATRKENRGDVVLVDADERIIGRLQGRMNWEDVAEGVTIGKVGIQSLTSPEMWVQVQTDSQGAYAAEILDGRYMVKAFARGVRGTVVRDDVKITAGGETRVNFSLEDLGTCFIVDDDAVDEGDGSAEHPFQTIPKALEATSEGDTVRVMAGIYREPVILVSGVTLLGAGPDSTILDGEGKRGVVQITDADHVALEGFAIVRGKGQVNPSTTGPYRSPFAGIVVSRAHHVRIMHNLISENTNSGPGGGIACYNVDSTVVIAHNLIVGNSTERSQWSSIPGGGGIYLGFFTYLQGAKPLIHSNTVVYNHAVGDGGGILCEGVSPYLRDNIIAYNLNGGLAYKPVSGRRSEQAEPGPQLSHNDIWDNAEYDYSGVDPGEGDTAVDPEFLAPKEGDFTLSRGSPCKKAGTTGSIGADVEVVQRGKQGLRAAISPKEISKQFKGVSPASGTPVVRKVNYLSVKLPAPRKLRIDTVQVEVHPLDLEVLDRHEKVYDRSSGLPGNQVNVVAPAPDGSIWVGTNDRGATRYDGLWTYLDTLSGLPGNQVNGILPARDGTVWIATNGGLARYRDGQVMTVSKEWFGGLVEDPRGGLWLGGSLTAHLDTAWTYLSFPGGAESSFIPDLVDQGGALWCTNTSYLTATIVLRYDPPNLQAYEFPYTYMDRYRTNRSFLQAADGKFWIALSEYRGNEYFSSIALLDTNATRLRIYRLPEEWGRNWSWSWRSSLFQDRTGLIWVFGDNTLLQYDGQRWFGEKNIEFTSPQAALDQEGNFWFASYDRGAIRYGSQTWTSYKGEERLEGKWVTCMAEDLSGNLYFGSEHGLGRRKVDGTWTRLSVTDTLVTDLVVDKQGQVWAATALGVQRYDGRQWTGYAAKNGLPDTVTTVLTEGIDGRIWAGGPKGLFWYDGQRWQNMPMGTWRTSEWRDPNAIEKLYADPEGKLWIATRGGLYVYDQGKVLDYFEVFYPDRGVDLDRLFVLGRPEEIRQKMKEMLKDEVDMAWFLAKVQPDQYYGATPDPSWSRVTQAYTQLVKEDATFRTLSRRATEEGYAINYGNEAEAKPEWRALAYLGSQFIGAIFADQKGAIWIPSSGGLFTRNDSTWTQYQQSALPFEGWITNPAIDHQGNLWLATGRGAVRYDGQHWTTFDASDGLADNQVSDILEDREGNIWFATAKGLTRYRPDTHPPQTRMVHAPEDTVGYGTSVLTFEFEGGDREWEQRSLSFSYTLVKGDRPPQEGDWSAWKEQKFIQMPPPGDGHFTFYVRARDKALNVDPTPATHPFYIAPPLWKVVWFQVSTGFGLLLIVFSSTYAVQKRRQARKVERQLFAEMEKELQTAHDLQMGLMPKEAPRLAGFEFAGHCFTANHVGGDFFKYYPLPQGHILGVLADVTGHAMDAAVPLLMFSGILETQMEQGGSIEDLFSRLNRTLHRTLSAHTFVCLVMGDLDLATRTLRLSNGGCPYPYHYSAATGGVTELQMDAYPLGVRPDTAYQTIEVQLEPGDRVVFCSDGIIEATNAAGEQFGYERTAEAIRKGCQGDLPAGALLDRIIAEVKGFSQGVPQGDDQTVVVLKVEI